MIRWALTIKVVLIYYLFKLQKAKEDAEEAYNTISEVAKKEVSAYNLFIFFVMWYINEVSRSLYRKLCYSAPQSPMQFLLDTSRNASLQRDHSDPKYAQA